MKHPTNPEAGPSDTVPALLTPGEAVIPASVAQDKDYKPIIEEMVNEGRKRNRQAEAQGIPVNHPVASLADGTLDAKISKIYKEGYTAPGQAYAIAKSKGYQGGTMQVPKPMGAPPKYNVREPDHSQWNKPTESMGQGDQMMMTNAKHKQSVANKEGSQRQKMDHARQTDAYKMKVDQMKADQKLANEERKKLTDLKYKAMEQDVDEMLTQQKQAALDATMDGYGFFEDNAPPPPMGMADGGEAPPAPPSYDQMIADNMAYGRHAAQAQMGNQASSDYADLLAERQALAVAMGAGQPLGLAAMSPEEQAAQIAAFRASGVRGHADGTASAQQAAQINALLDAGMTMEDIKQYLGEEIGALAQQAPPPPMAEQPNPMPAEQRQPIPSGVIYGGGPSKDAQALLGQIQGKADGDTDIVVDGRFMSSHVPEIQGYASGLFQHDDPDKIPGGFGLTEPIASYQDIPSPMVEPIPIEQDIGAAVDPMGSLPEAPDLSGPGYFGPAIDTVAQGLGAIGRGAESIGGYLGGFSPLQHLDPLYEAREQGKQAEAMTAKLEAEQQQMQAEQEAQAEQQTTTAAANKLGVGDNPEQDVLKTDPNGNPIVQYTPEERKQLQEWAEDDGNDFTAEAGQAAEQASGDEKRGWLAELGQSFKSALGQLANPDDLATAAIVFGANKLMGYDSDVAGEQALKFWQKGQDSRAAAQQAAAKREADFADFRREQGVKAGVASRQSTQDFQEALALQQAKDRTAAVKDAKTLEKNFVKDSRAYNTKVAKDAFGKGGFAADQDGNRLIASAPETIAAVHTDFLKSKGITDFESAAATQTFETAMRRASEHAAATGQQVRDIKPWLESSFIERQVGLGSSAMQVPDKNGNLKPMAPKRINELDRAVDIATLPSVQAGKDRGVAREENLNILGKGYANLPEDRRLEYERRGKAQDVTGFYLYAMEKLQKLEQKRRGG